MKTFLMILCCALTVFTVKAQFSGAGSGTEEDPYQITNADELAEMAYFLGNSHKGTCFKVMNDIDLTTWIAENNPTAGWNPIGVQSDHFKGNLDGDNHTISGFYVNRPALDYVGFFGYIESAAIKNLQVSGSSVSGHNQTGGLFGEVTSSSVIDNCKLTLTGASGLSGRENTGGLIGCIYNSTISNSEYVGKVKGSYNDVGGIAGRNEYSTFNNCSAKADIECPNYENVGGIIGYSNRDLTCFGCKHKGDISGKNYVGGVVGYSYSYYNSSPELTFTITISSCCHYGNVSGTDYIGGLLGKSYHYGYYRTSSYNGYTYYYSTNNTKIEKCFVSGEISGVKYVGGIFGDDYRESGNFTIKILNCYTYVDVIGSTYVGGIAGEVDNTGSIRYCYLCGSVAGTENVGGIIGHMANTTVSSNCAIIYSLSANTNYGRICGKKDSGTLGALGSQQGNRAYGSCVATINGEEVTITDSELNGSGIGLSALRNPNTYIGLGWDFEDTWTINNGLTFPYLAWEKRVSHIQLSKTAASLTLGETSTIEATITPTDADMKDLEWTSSDETIVNVDNGTITAIAEGTATITVKAKDGSEMSATCVVTVSNTQDSDPADFDNVVYMQSFSAELGDEIDVPILLKNQNDGDITGFDFYLYLPDGITPVLDEDEFPVISISTGRTTARKHAIFGDIEADGSIHIYTNATRPTYTFSGTGGEVATISLKVADDAPNGVQQIVLRNISIESISEEDPFEVLRYNLSASIGRLTFGINDGETLNIAQAKTYDEVNYSRTFSAAGKWQALYLPFSIPVETLTANGLEVAELNDTHMYDTDEDGQFDKMSIEFLYLKSGATTPNYPYLIKASEASEVNLSLPNTEVCATTATQIECATTRQTFKIKGTYAGVSGADMYNNNYYAMGGGSLVRVEDATSGLKPQRWYLSIENKDGSPVEYFAPSMRIMINGVEIEEEETTGIQSIVTSSDSETIYTLDGRKMNPNETLPAGIYVKNRQKMIVR